ncbi:MAG: ferric reductase-like transmembrane domain-containing protein [Chloroflexota bacterium]
MTKLTRLTPWIPPAVHGLALIPMVVLLGAATMTIFGALTPLGFVAAAGELGDLTLILFSAMLACTPLNIVFGWKWPLRLKRPLGLYTFMYAAIHYLVFVAGFQFNLGAALGATAASNMLLFGFLGLALMAPLALTSNKWSMRKLGRKWKRLHMVTYAVAIFIALHMLFLGQGAITVPLYVLLLGVRIPSIRRKIVTWRQRRQKRAATRTTEAAVTA